MRSINSLIKWILFVPICVMSVVITFFNGLYPGSVGKFLATNDNGVARIIAFSVLGLFVLSFVISLFDRKTSPVHMLRKNYFCGIMAVAAAIAMAANAAFDITSMLTANSSFKFMTVITALLTGVSGIAMLYMGLNHFSGSNSKGKISLLYVSLPLWCGAHLIDRFLNNTATPVAASETMDLIMFVAMAMFFINVTMIHSVIAVKNSVKSAINFGLPAVVIAFVFSVSEAFKAVNGQDFTVVKLVPSIAYGFLGIYALGVVAELSFRSKTIDEQVILEPETDDNEYTGEYYSDEEVAEVQDEEFEDIDNEATENYADNEISEFTDDDSDISFFEEDNEEVYSEDDIDFDDDVVEPAVNNIEVSDDNTDSFSIRIADSDDDDEVVTSENLDFTINESDGSDDASELFKAAQQSDMKRSAENIAKISVPAAENVIAETDDAAEDSVSQENQTARKSSKHHEKLKGPTTREAIMYEDEEFILSGSEAPEGVHVQEEVSAYIFDEHKETEDTTKSYEQRLDEIDKLIISIQGGDSSEEK